MSEQEPVSSTSVEQLRPVTSDLGRPKKVEYISCECGFRKQNTQDMGPVIQAGDYCPKCGDKLTEYNELQRVRIGRCMV